MSFFTVPFYEPLGTTGLTAAARHAEKLTFDLSMYCSSETIINIIFNLLGIVIITVGVIIKAIRGGDGRHVGVWLFGRTEEWHC
uniref:Uncharacterized protein n=1 Tax=Arundo donax TaxID=35708 RepID=A0A0A9H2G2_ARUDO